MERTTIDAAKYRGIVFLTGAGISVASGIRPYRGPDGLWNDAALVRLSDGDYFRKEPLEVWRFWSEARRIAAAAAPNAAHLALARLEAQALAAGGRRVTVITQNIDGLHARAGSRDVIEYHGSVTKTRCSNPACDTAPWIDSSLYLDEVPRCPSCGGMLRPDIVLFHEMIPEANARAAMEALEGCDLFVAIGTSGTVYPANEFVRWASRSGARTVYLNLEGLDDREGFFEEQYLGRAEELVPRVFGEGTPMGSPSGKQDDKMVDEGPRT